MITTKLTFNQIWSKINELKNKPLQYMILLKSLNDGLLNGSLSIDEPNKFIIQHKLSQLLNFIKDASIFIKDIDEQNLIHWNIKTNGNEITYTNNDISLTLKRNIIGAYHLK